MSPTNSKRALQNNINIMGDRCNAVAEQSHNEKKVKQKSRKLTPTSADSLGNELQTQYFPTLETRRQTSFSYDTTRYDFREVIIAIFECHCPGIEESTALSDDGEEVLSMLHTIADAPSCPNRTVYHSALNNIKNAKTQHEKALYKRYNDLLLDFTRNVAAPLMNEPPDNLLYQRQPTLRVSPPSTQPMGVPHTDAEYHHQPAEVNFWIPLTKVHGTNTLHVESAPGAGDFSPIELRYGQGERFWGNRCRHYTVSNCTETTRVSLDLRVVARDRHNEGFVDARGRVGVFTLGGYYYSSQAQDEEKEEKEIDM